MKVENQGYSWRFFNSAIKDHSLGKSSTLKKMGIQKLRPDKRFLSWPLMPRRQLESLVGYECQSELAITTLEALLTRYDANKGNYSKDVVGRSLDDFSIINMKRAIDIERMMSLVKNTLSEMKSIASVFSARHVG